MADILYKELSFRIVGAAMEVYRHLGPGFLEQVYHNALAHEMTLRAIPFEAEKDLPARYKELVVGNYRADFLVDGQVILELKTVTALIPAHFAQAQHYLAVTGLHLAILINFGAQKLQTKRIAK